MSGDRLEMQMETMLEAAGIAYTRPERDRRDPTTLDFHLTKIDIYIEVKQFHTPRLSDQLALVSEHTSVMVLVGPESVKDFQRLKDALSAGPIL